MSNVAIQKIENFTKGVPPIFEEVTKRLEQVRLRALELFETRGREFGHALEDWLKAEREILGGWSAAELKETDGNFELDMTLPGYDAKEVQVTVTPNEIIVHADTRHEKKTVEGQVLWSEFGSNSLCRRIELPKPIDVDKTKATLEKGLLHVAAVKAPMMTERRVQVAAA